MQRIDRCGVIGLPLRKRQFHNKVRDKGPKSAAYATIAPRICPCPQSPHHLIPFPRATRVSLPWGGFPSGRCCNVLYTVGNVQCLFHFYGILCSVRNGETRDQRAGGSIIIDLGMGDQKYTRGTTYDGGPKTKPGGCT